MKLYSLVAGLGATVVRGETAVLSLLHYNDVHARVEKVVMGGAPCEEGSECFGGLAKVATVIKTKREEAFAAGHIPLVLDAGDQFMGTVWNTYYKGEALGPLHNMMAIDAFTFGNHEFDFGPSVLADFVAVLETEIVVCNLDFSEDPNFANLLDKIKHHTMLSFDVNGSPVKVAVVGYSTEDSVSLSSPGDFIKFTPAKEAIPGCVKAAVAEGADAVVLLGHSGYSVDKEIAAIVNADPELAAAVIAIVGGHSHTPLGSMDGALEGEEYPTLVEGLPVVQAYFGTIYMGAMTEIEFTFGAGQKKKKIVRVTGTPLTLADDVNSPNYVADDPEVQAKIEELAGPLDEFRLQEISEAMEFLDGERESVRYTETNLGHLITDAMAWKIATGTSLPETHGPIEAVLINGGGIRSSINEGMVTVEEVLTVLPFGNQIAVLKILGADLRSAVEEGIRLWAPMGEGDLSGSHPHVAGMKIIFDGNAESLSRITSFEIMVDGVLTVMDDTKHYVMCTNDFLSTGGDGYESFLKAELISSTVANMADALGEYMKELGQVQIEMVRRLINTVIDDVPSDTPGKPTTAGAGTAAVFASLLIGGLYL